jgi:hypothetical protein
MYELFAFVIVILVSCSYSWARTAKLDGERGFGTMYSDMVKLHLTSGVELSRYAF